MNEGYLVVKDGHQLTVVCLNSIVDTTPIASSCNDYVFNRVRTLEMTGCVTRQPIPFSQIIRDIGYANAYNEIQVGYDTIHDEISQLERYRDNLKNEIDRLNQRYNNGVSGLKRYETWYEKVTEFDEAAYYIWCQMKCNYECNHIQI